MNEANDGFIINWMLQTVYLHSCLFRRFRILHFSVRKFALLKTVRCIRTSFEIWTMKIFRKCAKTFIPGLNPIWTNGNVNNEHRQATSSATQCLFISKRLFGLTFSLSFSIRFGIPTIFPSPEQSASNHMGRCILTIIFILAVLLLRAFGLEFSHFSRSFFFSSSFFFSFLFCIVGLIAIIVIIMH